MTHCLSVQRSQGLRSGGLGGPGGASFSSCAARNCLRGGEQREGWATPSLSSDQGFLLKVQLASVKLPFKWIAVHWHCSSKCKFFVYFKEVFLSSFYKHMLHPSLLYTCALFIYRTCPLHRTGVHLCNASTWSGRTCSVGLMPVHFINIHQ